MKIGTYSFNMAWWGTMDYPTYVHKYKVLELEKHTGLKVNVLAKKLGIEVPKDDKEKGE